jgi:hypothetical protein
MLEKSQKQNMKDIARLVSMDLGYIYGERESGPNGAKKVFLSKSAAFLRALGKDLGLKEMKVNTNPGGIAVSGDVTLYGMWSEGNGIYFNITEPLRPFNSFLYRHIKGMKDFTGGPNQWLPCAVFEDEDYQRLIGALLALRKQPEGMRYAA